jgi:hypothetical protein
MAVIGIFLTLTIGVLFYVLLCRRQLAYGLVELVVALLVIVLTFYPQTNYLLLEEEPPRWGWLLSKSVGTSAGIYVMVRGLDNIGKGLPPKWRGKWDRIFYGRASPLVYQPASRSRAAARD